MTAILCKIKASRILWRPEGKENSNAEYMEVRYTCPWSHPLSSVEFRCGNMAGLLTPDPEFFNPSRQKPVDCLKNLPDTAAGPCRNFTCFPFHLSLAERMQSFNTGIRSARQRRIQCSDGSNVFRVRHHIALYIVSCIISYTICSVNTIYSVNRIFQIYLKPCI